MQIKLLCVETSEMCDVDGSELFTIDEGDIVNAIIDDDGVCFEYEKNIYSAPYYYEDVEKYFISAFDEESYNKIYQKVTNCKMYFEDGRTIDLGNGRAKMEI